MPTAITLSRRTKELLARLKGEETWDEFLLKLAEMYRRERTRRALEELRKVRSDVEYEEVRLRLKLRE